MTASIQERIQAAMLEALLGATAAGAAVSRSRETFMSRQSNVGIGIFPGEETDRAHSDRADVHELIVNVDVFGRGDPWYTVADAIAVEAHRLLMNDLPLRSLIVRIRRISRTPHDDETDLTAGEYRLEYRITYLSNTSDIADATTF